MHLNNYKEDSLSAKGIVTSILNNLLQDAILKNKC